MLRKSCAIIALAVAGCSDNETTEQRPVDTSVASTPTSDPPPAPTPTPMPTPNYAEREGDRYFYVAEVSEEDRKNGNVVGNVSQYRYLGDRDGRLTLEGVTESGVSIGRLECARECRIMKSTIGESVTRLPYSNTSIAGAAMEDALNGLLVPVKAAPVPTVLTRIPIAFIGEYNDDLSACGTGMNDSGLRVRATTVAFYESETAVTRVIPIGSKSVKIEGVAEGEGQRRKNSFRLTLISNDRLSVDGSDTRARCP